MKGVLQFCESSNGYYRPAGLENNMGKEHKARYIFARNRIGEWESIGYQARIIINVHSLNSELLTQTEWYFRIYFANNLGVKNLGLRTYLIHYNGLAGRNYDWHQIIIEYDVALNDYEVETRIDPDIPGSIFVEGDPIYIP